MRAATLPQYAGEIPLHGAIFLSIIVATELIFGGAGVQSVHQPIVDDTISLTQAPMVDQSLNWSGYVAKGGDYSAVSGSWIVPTVSSSDSLAADATWVGIGGAGNRSLIQAGTQAIVEHGTVEYQAWLEGLPGESVEVPLTVSPGDVVSASIQEASPGEWRVTLHNETAGGHYETTVAYDSVHTSAEWIEEMPSGNVFIPLDRFDSVHFLSASAVKDGQTVTPLAASARPVTMVNGYGDAMAQPSVLSDKGDAFKVERSSAVAVSAQDALEARLSSAAR